MMRRISVAALTTVLALTTSGALAGCAQDSASVSVGPAHEVEVPEHHRTLQSMDVPYVGDASRIRLLLDALGVPMIGSRTMELHTTSEPYGMTVRFKNITTPVGEVELHDRLTAISALILAKVHNCQHVSWVVPMERGDVAWKTTVDDATRLVGTDVKTMDTGSEEFAELLRQARP